MSKKKDTFRTVLARLNSRGNIIADWCLRRWVQSRISVSVALDHSSWNHSQYETQRRYSQEECYSAKASWLTSYTSVTSPSATIKSNIVFQKRRTYPLYQHHITISYHHIQYTISREDSPTIPTSYLCQLSSHPIYHFKRGGLTCYTNIISLSATITSNIPFQERRTYPLYQHHITVSYHHIQYTISREEDLHSIPTSHHC